MYSHQQGGWRPTGNGGDGGAKPPNREAGGRLESGGSGGEAAPTRKLEMRLLPMPGRYTYSAAGNTG